MQYHKAFAKYIGLIMPIMAHCTYRYNAICISIYNEYNDLLEQHHLEGGPWLPHIMITCKSREFKGEGTE